MEELRASALQQGGEAVGFSPEQVRQALERLKIIVCSSEDR